MPLYAERHPDTFIGFSYIKKKGKDKKNILMILANSNPFDQQYLRVDIRNLRQVTENHEMKGKLLFSTHEDPRLFEQFIDYNTLDIHLGPGEVKIIEL